MRREDLVKEALKRTRTAIPIETANDFALAFLEAMRDAIGANQNIELRGFGAFHVRSTHRRPGRNVRTGEPVDIPAHRSVRFHPGRALRDRLWDPNTVTL